MQQIKFFRGLECSLDELEKEMNTWLADSNVKVVNIFGNLAPQTIPHEENNTVAISKGAFPPSDIFMAVVYEK